MIAGRNAGTILQASFRRHSLLDSESIPNQVSVYCESIPSLRRLKTHIRAYGTCTYGAMHGLKIRVSAVQRIAEFRVWPVSFKRRNIAASVGAIRSGKSFIFSGQTFSDCVLLFFIWQILNYFVQSLPVIYL